MNYQHIVIIQALLFTAVLFLTLYHLLQLRASSRKQQACMRNEVNTLNLISHYLKSIDQQILLYQNITERTDHEEDGANLSYNFAKKILDTGGSIDEIVRGCKLTHGEAELLSALHKPGS